MMAPIVEDVDKQTSGKGLRPTTLLIWAAVFGLLALFAWGLVNNSRARPEMGAPAPDFALSFFDGYRWENATADTVTLADFRGHIVVLNFWASWCVECRYEADELERTWQSYRDDGVVILGVAYVDTESKSLGFLKEFNNTYPNGPDLGTKIAKAYDITAVPETFIIDQQGHIADIQIGPLDEARLLAVLDRLLAQNSN